MNISSDAFDGRRQAYPTIAMKPIRRRCFFDWKKDR